MPSAAKVSDSTAHGGLLVLGSTNVLIDDCMAVRLKDPQICPACTEAGAPHVGGVVCGGSTSVYINDVPAARLGDRCDCQSVGKAGTGVPGRVGPNNTNASDAVDRGEGEASWSPIPGFVRLVGRGWYRFFGYESNSGDRDGDGTRDSYDFNASAASGEAEGSLEVGPMSTGIALRRDEGLVENSGHYHTGPDGVSMRNEGQVVARRTGIRSWFGNRRGVGGFGGITFSEGRGAGAVERTAEGDTGRESGGGAREESGSADIVAVDANTGLDLGFIRLEGGLGVSEGLGAGDGHVDGQTDNVTGETRWRRSAAGGPFGGWYDIRLRRDWNPFRDRGPSGGRPGALGGPIPNVIATGSPTVIIE